MIKRNELCSCEETWRKRECMSPEKEPSDKAARSGASSVTLWGRQSDRDSERLSGCLGLGAGRGEGGTDGAQRTLGQRNCSVLGSDNTGRYTPVQTHRVSNTSGQPLTSGWTSLTRYSIGSPAVTNVTIVQLLWGNWWVRVRGTALCSIFL